MKIKTALPAGAALPEQIEVFQGNARKASGHFAIVVSRFNEVITSRLLEGAVRGFQEMGVMPKRLHVFWCPGAFELPGVCQRVLKKNKYAGVVALGVVIRGETPHFDYVAGGAAEGILRVSLDSGVPIAFGVLTTDTPEQAEARTQKTGDNKGYDAALCVLETAALYQEIKKHS